MAGNVEWVCRNLEMRPTPEQVACAIDIRLDFTRQCFVPRTGAVETLAKLKSDARIYRLACDGLGLDPSGCIYVGDGSSQELTGALEVGMRPVLILGPDIDLAGVDRTDAIGCGGDVISSLPQVLEITDNEWGRGPVRVFESPQDRQAR